MYKVIFFAPTEHKEIVKEAMFAAGAGAQGHYTHCSFEVEGLGQFRPGPDSDPFIGNKEEVTLVPETKVEMLVAPEKITDVLRAMKEAHPYEEVAYEVYQLADF